MKKTTIEEFADNIGLEFEDAVLLLGLCGEIPKNATKKSSSDMKNIARLSLYNGNIIFNTKNIVIEVIIKDAETFIVSCKLGNLKTDTILWDGNDWHNRLLIGETYLDFSVDFLSADIIIKEVL